MSQVLLIMLGVYLAACYAYGMYVLVRLAMTRTVLRPTSRQEPTELARVAREELAEQLEPQGEQRIAA